MQQQAPFPLIQPRCHVYQGCWVGSRREKALMIFHARFLQREMAYCGLFIGLNAAEWGGVHTPAQP